MQKTITWKELVHDVVSMMPRDFTLAEVLKYRARFEQHFPNNRFVDAKIRQSLQVLRDQGFLRFVRPGTTGDLAGRLSAADMTYGGKALGRALFTIQGRAHGDSLPFSVDGGATAESSRVLEREALLVAIDLAYQRSK